MGRREETKGERKKDSKEGRREGTEGGTINKALFIMLRIRAGMLADIAT